MIPAYKFVNRFVVVVVAGCFDGEGRIVGEGRSIVIFVDDVLLVATDVTFICSEIVAFIS